jgi:1,4-alpha-glucan branching enzyme
MARPQSPLTKFIVSQPATATSAEVAAKAKEAGHATDAGYVTQVRKRIAASRKAAAAAKSAKKPARARPAGKKSAAEKATPKKTGATKPAAATKPVETKTAAAGEPSLSKSDWIRAQPASLAAAEVVAKAKAAGMKIEPVLVYKVRTRVKESASKKAGPPKVVAGTATAKPPTAPPAKVATTQMAKPVTDSDPRTSIEDLLRAVASEIGLARALAVLHEQRAQVLRVLGG